MDAPPSLPVLSPRPDPQPDRPDAGAPPRVTGLLGLIRRLIDYGTKLADALRHPAAGPNAPAATRIAFGTGNIALILASITRGLLRATALEDRLTRRAASGKDLGISPTSAPSPRQPRPARPATAVPEDPDLARLPTARDIAADIRRRPIGAVIADICHDFGIVPGQIDRALWDELVLAMVGYGGSLARFHKTMCQRVFPRVGAPAAPPPACPAPWPGAPVAVATRPP